MPRADEFRPVETFEEEPGEVPDRVKPQEARPRRELGRFC